MNYVGNWKNGVFYHDIKHLIAQGFVWIGSHTKPPSMAAIQRFAIWHGIPYDEHAEKVCAFRIDENKYVTMKVS